MTPLAGCVVAFVLGCLAGGVSGLDAEVAARGIVIAGVPLVLGARLAWAGHGRMARILAFTASAGLGTGLGAMAEARAWKPPGLSVIVLEQATAAGEAVQIDGVLRRDASMSPGGGVSLDLAVDRIWWRGAWHATRVGVRATVVGDAATSARGAWTRGRRIRAPVAALRRPLPYRNFGVPDAERALARRGLRLFATIKSASLVESVAGPWWEEAAAHVRARVRRAVTTHVTDQAAAATVSAILIGDRSSLQADLVRNLQHAGVYHVVAISGGNVGIWLALLVWLPRAAGAGARLGMAWLVVGLLGFAAVVDGGASVTRAVTAAGVVVVARWWDIRASALQALVVAAGLQWLGDPLAWHDAGCVLSFGAAGTLVALSSAWPGTQPAAGKAGGWIRRGVIALTMVIVATLGVEAVLLPVTARWFHVATAAGVLANVLAVPAMGVVQVAGLALVPAASLWPSVGDAIAVAATYGVRALLHSADIISIAPWLVREVPPPGLGVLVVYYGALAGAFIAATRRNVRACGNGGPADDGECRPRPRILRSDGGRGRARRGAIVACASVAVGCLAWIVTGGRDYSAPAPWTWRAAARWQQASWPAESWLLITFLDVGQGDATVIRLPSGRTWLVDAGGSVSETFDTGERVTSPALWSLGHRLLDRVVVTHAHPDHVGGMPTVIRRLAPHEVLAGIAVAGEERQAGVSDAAAASGARERSVAAGERLADGPVRLSVVHPERPAWERRRVRNDDSVVLWVRLGDVGVLLPGDVGQAVEDRMASSIAAAPLTVVRLAHHGSASSTGARLLSALQPVLAIGSMGRGNRFGHPAPAVLRRLADHRVPLLRTDVDGAIQLATNGRVLLVRTMAGREGSLTAGPPRHAWWLATPLPSRPGSPHQADGSPARAAFRPTRSGG